MAVIGSPPEGYAEIHAVVEAAVQAAMFAAKPGVKAHVVDDAARRVITQAGYGEYFMHRTGHGMGVEIHETPYISASSQTILKEGMVFSIEPGIYLPNRFGIRLEDIVILRADGPEILSNLPRDVKIING
jgi:Xaa-Pro aminopeptidase